MLREHDRAFSALDFDALARLWDEADAEPAYIAEEYARPQLGWRELNAHWGRLGARLQQARVSSELVGARLVGDGICLAIQLCEWSFVTVDSDAERSGRCWVTVLLRRRPAGWRLFHYMEAPIYFGEGDDHGLLAGE